MIERSPALRQLSEDAGDTEKRFFVAETIGKVLPRGHVVHGYSSASDERVFKILGSRKYSDSEPMLGFGVDGTAERALARSLITYAMREERGLEQISATQFTESEQGQITISSNPSRFDNIVWGSDFWLYEENGLYKAGSSYGSPNFRGGIEVDGRTPLDAIVNLTEGYTYGNNRVLRLPPVSFM